MGARFRFSRAGRALGLSAMTALVAVVAGCSEEPGMTPFSAYSVAEIENWNKVASIPVLLPTELPDGVSATDADPGTFSGAFRLATLETAKVRRTSTWIASFESAVLGGTFKVVQLPLNSTSKACGDFSDKASVAIEQIEDRNVRVCVPEEAAMTPAAATYWSTVSWTENPEDVPWLVVK